MGEMIGSDLDGTVRQPYEPFNSWRDSHPNKYVRVVAGIAATIFARRINSTIDADVYITGAPSVEDMTTRLWLKLHGMSTDVRSNPDYSRAQRLASPATAAAMFKADAINELGVVWYYEGQGYQAAYIDARTSAHVVLVEPTE